MFVEIDSQFKKRVSKNAEHGKKPVRTRNGKNALYFKTSIKIWWKQFF